MAYKRKRKNKSVMRNALMFIFSSVAILASLSIGLALIEGTLILPAFLGGQITASIVGWIISIGSGLGAITAILNLFGVRF